jgi:NAD(P)-dependent dehydrogenase (short-subunit alcohol dehydrogenase family)
MSSDYRNKVVLVTGGSYGIGRAAAIGFARRGARVAIADLDAKRGEETLRLVRDAGGDAIFVKTDVSSEAEVKALVDATVRKYGKLDCAFNNAGIHRQFVSTVDFTEAEWDEMINVNLKSVWLCMKYEIAQMLKQGKGAIVNTSSAAGLVGAPSNPAYPASKHGVVGITKSTALEFARKGIRVNCVCPGPTRTGMNEALVATNPWTREFLWEESANPKKSPRQPYSCAPMKPRISPATRCPSTEASSPIKRVSRFPLDNIRFITGNGKR